MVEPVRWTSDWASTGFWGSSMMKISPPSPVIVPYTDFDFRNPSRGGRHLVFEASRDPHLGNARRYHTAIHYGTEITGVLR